MNIFKKIRTVFSRLRTIVTELEQKDISSSAHVKVIYLDELDTTIQEVEKKNKKILKARANSGGTSIASEEKLKGILNREYS